MRVHFPPPGQGQWELTQGEPNGEAAPNRDHCFAYRCAWLGTQGTSKAKEKGTSCQPEALSLAYLDCTQVRAQMIGNPTQVAGSIRAAASVG